MAFIDKKDPVVLNIKLTSIGRELLSKGKLDFKYYAIGDSEIDYEYYDDSNLDPFFANILVPVDKNPNILSFIPRELSGDSYNTILNVPSTPTIVQNSVDPLGFFNYNNSNYSIITDTDHVKQPDVMVRVDEVSGGTKLNLYQSLSYLANVNEPKIGDYALIKWTNKYNDVASGTTGYIIDTSKPQPILIYKIQEIVSGALSTNNLVVVVDRELPDFSYITGGTSGVTAGAHIYYNYVNFTGNTVYNDYSSNYLNESVLNFLENCQCPTIKFPFWNMSIVYTEEIIGVQSTDKKYADFSSKKYGGFVSYIQNQSPIYKKLGIIHYSNSSPSNVYAEELFVDVSNNDIPIIDLPTIMWHKSSTTTLGLKLKAVGALKILTGETKSLNTNYYDLADYDDNIVGKVFVDLKLFVIEDPELLFAMSYKSNRSWTLPNYTVGVNGGGSNGDSGDIIIIGGCPTCTIDFDVTVTNASIIGNNDGSIYINNIINQILGSQLILEVSGQTSGRVYFDTIITDTLITGLAVDTYFIIIHDLGALNCDGKYVTISDPTSILSIYNDSATQSGLNTEPLSIINPTTIRINKADVGTIYGSLYVGVLPYGNTSSVSYLSNTSYKEFNLTFKSAYTFYVKDDLGGGNEFIVAKDYVAAGNPLNSANPTISNQFSDSGGTYVMVSSYLTTINPSVNPIVGDIEFTIYPINSSGLISSSLPNVWRKLPTGTPVGNAMKLYVNTTGLHKVEVRERYQKIIMFKIAANKTIS